MAQDNSMLSEKEALLDSLLLDLRMAEDNTSKKEKNEIFKSELYSFLENKEALTYNFTKLKTLGVIDSPDKQMRIVNWNVEQDDFSHKYYCYVLYFDKKKKKYRVHELKDISFGMPSQPTGSLDAESWYGALYYRIIPVKKGSRTMYTVLGWDHNSSLSQLKLIDVMYFTSSTVKLGNPIFKIGKKSHYRVFFEHSKKTSMYLNYEEDRKRIMMDHLSPESPALKEFRSYYVPDLSYDAFTYKNNKWTLTEDVIGVNKGEAETKQVVYVKNEKTGKLEPKLIKKKWENPEDPTAPAGGSEHVAVTPETEQQLSEKEKEANELDDRIDKKDKRDPNELSIVNGKKKKKRRKKRRKKKS
jgi:hypothetical protein